ncbi:MAG: Queuine tRNA-ribosyltransferase [Candidatus Daviesbacteria bacterium GW2011_GWA1_41_61]|nr:MAG: Queuine tRNA-ribosyltransferase [Candidatus Daviesbacteria bacterium GW2011_GWC1_40_9]KKR92673.1 MAG: Queuine tRNA-ribosyltransferase [Candidatus Daviesbacteria bacterium GW2011_GWB1_41_15]KKS14604.1 MAG: Queuine tRNA-ribosyltransferase [Candidatus Daviesbacteria bacterium GW2011_GWA1_41_61]
MSNFKIIATDKKARAGVLKTAHGEVQTPVFMPVGTQGTVKALSPDDLEILGAQIILGNTYHLYLRPGNKLIKKLGGLHQFMGWEGPILTDSGGFQAFSLGAMIEHGVKKIQSGRDDGILQRQDPPQGKKNRDESLTRGPLVSKITENGVQFVSHLDGSKHLLTPEKSMEIQLDLGSDICLVLDELLSPLHSVEYVRQSLERTHRWELRSKEYFQKHVGKSLNPRSQLFGILQGVFDEEIRKHEARWVVQQDFSGISIGGSFALPSEALAKEGDLVDSGVLGVDWAAAKAIDKTMEWVIPLLPGELPRHALGIGEVRDLFACIERGLDMFDCVAPMRRARNGSLYISPANRGKESNKFTLNISRSEFKEDKKAIDPGCSCYTCQNFSRAYLRHLYLAKELLYYRLATIHNVFFIVNLVKSIREAIIDKQFTSLKKKWII